MAWSVAVGDVVAWAEAYQGPRFHALLCDPPYEMGFLGKQWDGTGVAFQSATWKALAAHLHPGAFGAAFGGARTWHRLACAIEDAGLLIHPTIFGWATGGRAPKISRVKGDDAFAGHVYGRQALKGAVEPIIVFQKPYEGAAQESIRATGAGALWVDGCRIPTRENTARAGGDGYQGGFREGRRSESHPEGRWPTNLLLEHHPDCNGTCHADCPARALDEQAGSRKSGMMKAGQQRGVDCGYNGRFPATATRAGTYGDEGGVSRFYTQFWNEAVGERLEAAAPIYYAPRASNAEREAGTEGMAAKEHGGVRRGTMQGKRPHTREGLTVSRANGHPTVKPVALTRWLATLLLPPQGYAPRRLLVPFSGVGSEMAGAALAGWEAVQGVEQAAEYAEIAEARLRHWTTQVGEREEMALEESAPIPAPAQLRML